VEIIRWTYHKCDPVPAEVELSQSLQASKAGDTRDLIASQIEHPQMCEVAKILNVTNLELETSQHVQQAPSAVIFIPEHIITSVNCTNMPTGGHSQLESTNSV